MLISITLSVILLVGPCTLSALDTSRTNFLTNNESNSDLKLKRDLWDILNPVWRNTDNNSEEHKDVDLDVPVNFQMPKITIWEFPNERRAFIDDHEIVISPKDDAENSHEVINPDDKLILHPHKNHDLHSHKVGDESDLIDEISPFQVPELDDDDNDAVNVQNGINIRQRVSDGLNRLAEYFAAISREKRNLSEGDINKPDKVFENKDTETDTTKSSIRRTWGIIDYLYWLINRWQSPETEFHSFESTESDENDSVLENELEFSANRVMKYDETPDDNKTSVTEVIANAEIPDKRINLLPVNPNDLKEILEKLKSHQMKRSVQPIGDVDLLLGTVKRLSDLIMINIRAGYLIYANILQILNILSELTY